MTPKEARKLDEYMISQPYMEYYRHVYRNSRRWDYEESLEGKRICLFGSQGFGDQIQFLRFIPNLKNCHVIYHCPAPLIPLMKYCKGVNETLSKDEEELPDHDLHMLMFSLPFTCIPTEPYIHVDKKIDLEYLEDGLKVGVAWEGSQLHPNNKGRNIPLTKFRPYLSNARLFCLQKEINDTSLTEGCEDMELFGVPLNNFADTAELINSLDYVVTVDTAVLHLAGAMGKKVIALLGKTPDPRWQFKWYENMTVIPAQEQQYKQK